MAVKSCSPRGKHRLTVTWSSLSRVGPFCQRHLPLFVEEPSLPRAGDGFRSCSHLTAPPVLSSRFLPAGGNHPGGGNGAGDLSGGASRAATIGVEYAGLAVSIAGKGVDGGWRMGWCGYTIAEATGGPIRDSCSGEEFNLQAGAIPDFGQAGVEADVAASRGQRKLPQGFFTRP